MFKAWLHDYITSLSQHEWGIHQFGMIFVDSDTTVAHSHSQGIWLRHQYQTTIFPWNHFRIHGSWFWPTMTYVCVFLVVAWWVPPLHLTVSWLLPAALLTAFGPLRLWPPPSLGLFFLRWLLKANQKSTNSQNFHKVTWGFPIALRQLSAFESFRLSCKPCDATDLHSLHFGCLTHFFRLKLGGMHLPWIQASASRGIPIHS